MRKLIWIAFWTLGPASLCASQGPGLAGIADDIVTAWDHTSLVCLGEIHGSTADAALRSALLEHPKFSETVDVVLFEGVSGIHQDLLDRFVVQGEALPPEALRPAFQDAGRGVLWQLPIYEELLLQLRRLNLTLPQSRRIRLIGGAVPIPWADIRTARDLLPWMDRRAFLEDLVQKQVLGPGLKGLAIFGAFHCEKTGASFTAALKQKAPGRIWSAFSLDGEAGAEIGRAALGLDERPLLMPITGTAHALKPAGAAFFEGHAHTGARFGDLLDAVIHYGDLVNEVRSVDEELLDPAFRRELARRDRLRREAAGLAAEVP